MYKLQVLILGVVTLLAFTEGAPVSPTTSSLLKAIQIDIGNLKKSQSVISKRTFLVQTDIKASCLNNSLACFTMEMCSVQTVINMEDEGNNDALDIIDKIMTNAYEYLGLEYKSCEDVPSLESIMKICQASACEQKEKSQKGEDFLTELTRLLQRIVSSQ